MPSIRQRFHLSPCSDFRSHFFTGLETAIILIAFVVVASVFSFTILSTGLYSAEKGEGAVRAGIEEARGSLTLTGSIIAYRDGVDPDGALPVATTSGVVRVTNQRPGRSAREPHPPPH